MKDKRLGKYTFSAASESKKGPAPGSAKAVWVTACGNFGLVASSTGVIHMYNMQSGARRKSFDLGPYPLDDPEQAGSKKKAERSVTGLASDALDRIVIASTLDGTINVRRRFCIMLTIFLLILLSSSSISIPRHSNKHLFFLPQWFHSHYTVTVVYLQQSAMITSFVSLISKPAELFVS